MEEYEEYTESDETDDIYDMDTRVWETKEIPKLEFISFRKTPFSDIPETLVHFYRKIKARYIYNQLSKLNFLGKSIDYDMIDFNININFNINDLYSDDCILNRDITFWFSCPKTGYECSISFTTLHAYDHNPDKTVNKFYKDNKITAKDKVYRLHIYNEEWVSEIYSNIIVIRDNHSIEFYNSLKERNNTGYITDRYFPDENRIYFTDIIKLIKLK